jgi:hypothetical protein
LQTSAVMASHAGTTEWQSFEMRMRQRRVDRLLLRADVAVEAGCVDEARECLAEVRSLTPNFPGLAEAEKRLREYSEVDPAVPIDSVASTDPVASASRRKILAIAASIGIVAALTAWRVQRTQVHAPARDHQPIATAANSSGARLPLEPPQTSGTLDRVALDRSPSSIASASRPEPARSESARPELARSEPVRAESTRSEPTRPQPAPVEASRAQVPRIAASAGTDDLPGVTTGAPAIPKAPETPVGSGLAPVSLPDPLVATTAAPKTDMSPPADTSQEALVRRALNRYAAAYSDLDADAAQRAWPGVNRAALSRAFDALTSQRVSLGECRIQIAAATAQARCAGSATWSPKIGSRGSRTEKRNWTFDLARAGSAWQIVNARVQNR